MKKTNVIEDILPSKMLGHIAFHTSYAILFSTTKISQSFQNYFIKLTYPESKITKQRRKYRRNIQKKQKYQSITHTNENTKL